ncbi:diaminopimelate decarboxylase [Enterobacteriaceae endosymbiont of Neohaemonia nigricornis]|uniref:diaminopimelate decarboxylase n=1 Tax=Enterobacteriaceae endosymbiont of Neohaemonia nigricornis TaxID=2675792 RepID=UPI00144A00EB|nr:diaminopimelate decarboxylase [Enterobacteriaceae endosymbiont of Neohaemonia nigricornis]QJC30584.1 diaminopimelate decarboxylase [Enterobacteriaceae endosymbiont of Neohaemonia nigricornis]
MNIIFDYKNNKNKLSIQIIQKIIKKYYTPCWVYYANNIKNKILQLKKFDIIRFAQKACSNIHILKFMRKQQVKIDAVSLGEIERALYAGYNPNQDIIFTADIFEKNTLKCVIELNITVNIGSIDMLHQLGKLKKQHNIWLRINPGFGYGHNKKTNTGGINSKHGIWYSEIEQTLNIIKKYQFNLIGIHMHIGSGVNYHHLQKVCNAMLYNVTQPYMPKICAISVGGGLPIPYKNNDTPININNYFNIWDHTRNIIKNYFKQNITLEIEPGRFLVAESGILICQVHAIKNINNRRFILVNVGFNDLIRPAMYGSFHHVSAISYEGLDLSQDIKIPTIIAGPLCESGDVFTQLNNGDITTILLSINIKIYDYLIFHDTGAYGATMSSNYNSRPLIPEIFIYNNKIHQIRRQQTIQELISLEQVY